MNPVNDERVHIHVEGTDAVEKVNRMLAEAGVDRNRVRSVDVTVFMEREDEAREQAEADMDALFEEQLDPEPEDIRERGDVGAFGLSETGTAETQTQTSLEDALPDADEMEDDTDEEEAGDETTGFERFHQKSRESGTSLDQYGEYEGDFSGPDFEDLVRPDSKQGIALLTLANHSDEWRTAQSWADMLPIDGDQSSQNAVMGLFYRHADLLKRRESQDEDSIAQFEYTITSHGMDVAEASVERARELGADTEEIPAGPNS